ncbi:MAG: NRDE family protein [Myxococcota bacterium]
MCTVIVGIDPSRDTPLIVAANRDEDLDRPTEPPQLRVVDGVRVFAPRDVLADGTWLGLNEHGLFVALTNRFGLRPDPARRSRGQLVLSTLTASNAHEAFERTRDLDAQKENGFHLIMADRTQAFLVRGDMHALDARPLSPGWHAITERSFSEHATARETLIHTMISAWGDRTPTDDDLKAILTQPHPNGFDGVLVEVPSFNYGTRSSTLLRMRADGTTDFLHADGRPDRAEYINYSSGARFASPSSDTLAERSDGSS